MWWLAAIISCSEEGADPCAPQGPVPETVGDVVDRLAALPSPVSVSCYASSLPRPLPLEASEDIFSAQPAVGRDSPRLLVWYPKITLTFATDGFGAQYLEMGEETEGERSIKAEIVFPVTLPFDEAAAYDRVRISDGTSSVCIMCHGDEVEVAPGVFASEPFRPDPMRVVNLGHVETLADACPKEPTDDRCRMLRAIFDHGRVEHTPLPEHWPTAYGP